MSIRDILLNPYINGVASVIAIVTVIFQLIVSLTKSRNWLLQSPNTKWIIRIPWALLLFVVGIVLGVSLGAKYQNVYLGLFVVSSIAAIGIGIKWLQDSLLLSRYKDTYNKLAYSYNNILKAIERQDTEFTLRDWNVTHIVHEDGTGLLKEQVTIMPVAESVNYYYVRYRVFRKSESKGIKFNVVNVSKNTPLDFYEVEKNEDSVKYMVILDPPSTKNNPTRISIECERIGVWDDLIKYGKSEGSLDAKKYKADKIMIEVLSPPFLRWKALNPSPVIGNVEMDLVENRSRVIWEIPDPSMRKYTYRVFLDGTFSKEIL